MRTWMMSATSSFVDAALFGRVRLYSLRTQLCIFDGNRPPKRIPQVNDVGDDHALAFLGRDFLRQQGRADASLDTGDLRLNQGAQPISIFLAKRINAAFFLDVANDLIVPFSLFFAMHNRMKRRWNNG